MPQSDVFLPIASGYPGISRRLEVHKPVDTIFATMAGCGNGKIEAD